MTVVRYLLDTNVFIHAGKRREPVVRRFTALVPGEAAQSVVTYGELLLGARKSENEGEGRRRLDRLVQIVPVLPLTKEVAETYASIRASLEIRGEIIGSNDLWIASHAIVAGLILVSANVREFSRISELQLENWAAQTN